MVFARLGTEGISVISLRPRAEGNGRLWIAKYPSRTRPARSEADIQRRIAADPDAPEATDEQLGRARPFAEVFPDLMESIRRGRGRPAVETPRQRVTLRLEADVLAKFRATGRGWQTRINEILKRAKV